MYVDLGFSANLFVPWSLIFAVLGLALLITVILDAMHYKGRKSVFVILMVFYGVIFLLLSSSLLVGIVPGIIGLVFRTIFYVFIFSLGLIINQFTFSTSYSLKEEN